MEQLKMLNEDDLKTEFEREIRETKAKYGMDSIQVTKCAQYYMEKAKHGFYKIMLDDDIYEQVMIESNKILDLCKDYKEDIKDE